MLILSSRTYDLAKKLVEIILPAFTALYVGLSALWDLPAPEKVAGTVALISTFIGVCLGISSSTFKKVNDLNAGTIVVDEEEGRILYSLEVNGDPEEIASKSSVTFKVHKET